MYGLVPWLQWPTIVVKRELSVKNKPGSHWLMYNSTPDYGVELWVVTKKKKKRSQIQAAEVSCVWMMASLCLGDAIIRVGLRLEPPLLHIISNRDGKLESSNFDSFIGINKILNGKKNKSGFHKPVGDGYWLKLDYDYLQGYSSGLSAASYKDTRCPWVKAFRNKTARSLNGVWTKGGNDCIQIKGIISFIVFDVQLDKVYVHKNSLKIKANSQHLFLSHGCGIDPKFLKRSTNLTRLWGL